MSVQHYRPLGPLDPLAEQIAAFFGQNPLWQALDSAPLSGTRAAIREATPMSGEPALDHVDDVQLAVSGGEILLRVYRPTCTAPAIIVWAHGGGFILGSVDEIDNFARLLALETGCVIVSVGYRLAPEHPFPTAIEDVEAALAWIASHADQLAGQENAALFAGGDSAGANLATVATRRLHERGEYRITGNILAYPCTDNADTTSLQDFVPPFLTAENVRFFLDSYQPDTNGRSDPDFAPIRADDLDRLPPSFILTAEHDVITGQAEDYGRALIAAGVPVRLERYLGMIHGFLTMDAFFPTAAGAAISDIRDFVAAVLDPLRAEASDGPGAQW